MNKKEQLEAIKARALTTLTTAKIDMCQMLVKVPVDEFILTYSRTRVSPETWVFVEIE